jgi:RNA polymerase sigma-70 factor, ECF subfamily
MRVLDPQSLPQYTDRLYRAAWGLCGSREEAEDLVQETFAHVLAKPRVMRGDGDLAYLMRVLRNTFLTGRRTAGRRPVTVASLEDLNPVDQRPMGRPEQALEVSEVYSAIAALPEDFRLALVAVDLLGLSYKDASRILDVREATITTRIFRARRQIVGQLTGLAGSRPSHRSEQPGPEPEEQTGSPPSSQPPGQRGREGREESGPQKSLTRQVHR